MDGLAGLKNLAISATRPRRHLLGQEHSMSSPWEHAILETRCHQQHWLLGF